MEDNNSNYKDVINEIIINNKESIFNFFNYPNQDLNINIYVYRTIDSLVDGLKNRGFANMPDYMCACQKDEDNSLNFFEPKDNPSDNEWSKEEYKK